MSLLRFYDHFRNFEVSDRAINIYFDQSFRIQTSKYGKLVVNHSQLSFDSCLNDQCNNQIFNI